MWRGWRGCGRDWGCRLIWVEGLQLRSFGHLRGCAKDDNLIFQNAFCDRGNRREISLYTSRPIPQQKSEKQRLRLVPFEMTVGGQPAMVQWLFHGGGPPGDVRRLWGGGFRGGVAVWRGRGGAVPRGPGRAKSLGPPLTAAHV